MEGRALPVGWATFSLTELGGTKGGKTPSKSRLDFWQPETVHWTSPKDLKVFELHGSEDKISDLAISVGGMEVLPAGSVLMVTRSGILSHTFPVAIARVDTAINQDIKAVKPIQEVDERFLAYVLRSLEGAILGSCSKEGTTVASVETRLLEKLPLPLAPLNEQRRIADKLDTTLAAVVSCRQRLDGVEALLKRVRQAVLAAATSGELTREWREEICAPEWELLQAADVCEKVQSGGTPKAGFIAQPGVPFLKVYNLVDQSVDFEYRSQYVESEVHLGPLAKSRTLPGDVLMNIVGPPLGKVAIVSDAYDEWNINQAICLFRAGSKITTEWLYYLLCEGTSIRQIQLETKGSAGQVNISLTQCRHFVFPVPSIQEQHEISRRVESLFCFADQLEAKLTAARKLVERLTPALLAKAFRGELVPQDPSDEPASVLLERIRAARQAEVAAGKAPRRGRRMAAANPDQLPLAAAPVPPDLLSSLLRECGALSERALLAASELDPDRFQVQLALEREAGAIRDIHDDGQRLLEAVAERPAQ